MRLDFKSTAGLSLLVVACTTAPPVQMHEPLQGQCALTTFPANERIGAWSVDKFAGRYTHEADSLVVTRDDRRLFVEGWKLGKRQLTADSVESWTWRDGCGVRFEFTLPPDGPGGWLKVVMPDGTATDWHR